MPHYFTTRARLYDAAQGKPGIWARYHWEILNMTIYKLGGVVFIIGSVLFFPRFEAYADWGAWVFFFGSLLYLVVTGHDWIELRRHLRSPSDKKVRRDLLEIIAVYSYLIGTLMFTVGSLFYLSFVGLFVAGTWLFILGSLAFALGAVINVLQVVQASDLRVLQLMNLTAVSYVSGSLLFVVASIPYLWNVENHHDHDVLHAFLAWQYIVGSVLFLLGGVFNTYRVSSVFSKALQAPRPARAG